MKNMGQTSPIARKEQKVTETLPKLVGTPKQVAWANDIRDTILKRIRYQKKGYTPMFDKRAEAYAQSLIKVTDATKWIDWRNLFNDDTNVVLMIEGTSVPNEEFGE